MDIFIHLLAHSYLRSFNPFNHFSVRSDNSSNNLLLTDQHTVAVSYMTYKLTGYFLRYLIADTLYNIPHPSSCLLVDLKPSELLARFKQILYLGFRATLNFRKFKMAKGESSHAYQKLKYKKFTVPFLNYKPQKL